MIPDGYHTIGKTLGHTDELIIISHCIYGSVSPEIKQLIDRSISYAHPFFVTEHHIMHHKRRYPTHFSLKLLFYGELTEKEQQTAREYADYLAKKFTASAYELIFYQTPEEITL